MAKYGKKIVEKIVGLVKSDTFTIAEICRQVGITPKTYHQWMDDYPDFADAIEQAKNERMQFFVQEAKKSLLKKIQGYDVTETKVVTIPSKVKDEKGNQEAHSGRHGGNHIHLDKWRPGTLEKQTDNRGYRQRRKGFVCGQVG